MGSKLEIISTQILLFTACLAFIISNTPLHPFYERFLYGSFFTHLPTFSHLNFLSLINDGLMTLFFLLVGLDIKYDVIQGVLNTPQKAALPLISALGGMLIPALFYTLFNYHDSKALRGLAIPTATDIAFSLSILFILCKQTSTHLQSFLKALAIADDLFAILIIACFYTTQLSFSFLFASFFCFVTLCAFNWLNLSRLLPYFAVGLCMWFFLLKSGIHPTLAGVLLAIAIPLESHSYQPSPLLTLQKRLHPWVAFLILPLFAFANAGVSLTDLMQGEIHLSIIVGIMFGLFIGKQIGVFGSAWLAVKCRLAKLPAEMNWRELYAIAIICGIGFTISLFIGELAFLGEIDYQRSMKVGVIIGSLLSGTTGYLVLRKVLTHKLV